MTRQGEALSLSQREIWLDQLLHPGVAVYNVGGCLRIHGDVDPELFGEALRRVVLANDALRLVFEPGESLPHQHASAADPDLVFHDLSGRRDPDGEALRFMEREMARPFELYGRPLVRFALVRAAPARHYWLAACHHVVVDGWSIALMARRVAAVYTALRAGAGGKPWENGGAPYLEHLREDDAYVGSPAWNRAREFWRGCFPTVPEPLFTTPTRDDTLRSAVVTFAIERARYDRLHEVAAGFGVSAFHLFAGVLATALHRRHGAGELVFGTPILNRRGRFKETIGPFVGMLPLRLEVAPAASFADLVRQASRRLRQAYRHQRFPLSEIHRSLGLVGGENGLRQLFDVALSFEKHDYGAVFDGLPIDVLRLGSGVARQPLLFSVQEYADDEDVRVYLEHQLAVLDPLHVQRLARSFQTLLDAVAADPERRISALPLLPASERHQVLVEWAYEPSPVVHADLLDTLVAAQVARTPGASAVVGPDTELSYAELLSAADRLAGRLRRAGAGPEKVGVVCLGRSPELMVSLLGVLRSGAAYLPLRPEYPEARLVLLLGDAGARIVVGSESLRERLPEDVCLVTDVLAETPEDAAETRRPARHPEQAAYVIYTSGSTGTPKGVVVSHRAISRRLLWEARAGRAVAERVLQSTPVSFDPSVREIFGTWMVGGTLVLARPDGEREPAYLGRLIAEAGIARARFVPAMLDEMLPELAAQKSLRIVTCGGERLPDELARHFFDALPGVVLENRYGPTEATISVSLWRGVGGTSRVTLGRPIAAAELLVLDRRLQVLPISVLHPDRARAGSPAPRARRRRAHRRRPRPRRRVLWHRALLLCFPDQPLKIHTIINSPLLR